MRAKSNATGRSSAAEEMPQNNGWVPVPPLHPRRGSANPDAPVHMSLTTSGGDRAAAEATHKHAMDVVKLPQIKKHYVSQSSTAIPKPPKRQTTSRRDATGRREKVLDILNETLSEAPPNFRTFDRKAGRVVYHSREEVPDLEKRTFAIYNKLVGDAYEVDQAERRVAPMSQGEQVRLAAMSLKRKAERALRRTLQRGLLDYAAALTRTQHALYADFRETVGHLGSDTQELSLIRLHNAATDEVLHQKAAYMASLEVERFNAVMLDQDVTPTSILGMQLDAFRHRNVVPFTPRTRTGSLAAPQAEANRRRSSDRAATQRTGIHCIVERQLQALQ